MGDQVERMLAVAAAVVGLGAGYGKVFGPFQCQIVEWVIAAAQIRPRFRGVVNLAVGVGLGSAFGALAAWQMGDWAILALGSIGGILASVEAARVHDEQS
jgi:hypothetical protein